MGNCESRKERGIEKLPVSAVQCQIKREVDDIIGQYPTKQTSNIHIEPNNKSEPTFNLHSFPHNTPFNHPPSPFHQQDPKNKNSNIQKTILQHQKKHSTMATLHSRKGSGLLDLTTTTTTANNKGTAEEVGIPPGAHPASESSSLPNLSGALKKQPRRGKWQKRHFRAVNHYLVYYGSSK